MAIIQVTPETLNSKASEVRSLRATHDDTMQKLRNPAHFFPSSNQEISSLCQ